MGNLLVGWGNGLPGEVLALIASLGGVGNLKAMRGVNKTWQFGFELAVKSIRVPIPGPILPTGEDIAARFPELTKLDVGDSNRKKMGKRWLWNLAAAKKLRCLVFGSVQYSRSKYSSRVGRKRNGLHLVQGLPLTSLDFSQCRDLLDSELEAVRGMPLMDLSLRFCIGVSAAGLGVLRGMPLASLSLDGCDQLGPSALYWLLGTPLTSLSFLECPKLVSDRGLAYLWGLPLISLAFSGKENALNLKRSKGYRLERDVGSLLWGSMPTHPENGIGIFLWFVVYGYSLNSHCSF